MNRFLLAVFVVVWVAVTIWGLWPAIGCDGDVVRGAFRLVCLK